MKREIENLDDIKLLVDKFYSKIREDDLLSDIFNTVIKDKWSEHLKKMYTFWQTVLLREHTYYGSPFVPHADLPVEKLHFDRWLKLFYETIDDYFIGEKAEEAKWRGDRMAQMFQYKIAAFRESNSRPLI